MHILLCLLLNYWRLFLCIEFHHSHRDPRIFCTLLLHHPRQQAQLQDLGTQMIQTLHLLPHCKDLMRWG